MDFDIRTVAVIIHDWENAPYGTKGNVVKVWAENLGCNVKTIYPLLETGRERRRGDYRIPGIVEATKNVAVIKKMPPESMGEISTDQAILLAVGNGIIPENMRNVPPSTFNRVARNLGLHKRKRRIQRFQALYPNQLHHVDASQSEIYYVDRALPDGDYMLKINPRPSKRYKNKPLKNPDRLRVWVYGLIDDFSGVIAARYTVAPGETAAHNLNFLCWAWSKADSKVFFGLPDRIKMDHGPLMKGKPAQDFLERLGIKVDGSEPGAKESHGKIERTWRTQWQRFEKPFFVESDRKNFEIKLSELNRRFLIFQEESNDMDHRFEHGVTRLQAWKQINLHGGAVPIPENALNTVARRIERTVRPDGCFSLDGETFEVRGLHDSKVFVYQGVFDDERIVVEDKATGEKYEVESFRPTPLDTFVGHKDTPHQKAVKAGKDLQSRNTLHEKAKEPGKVTHFPTKAKEARKIENPLNTDVYPSMYEAMSAFMSLSTWFPKGEDYERVKLFIEECGFNKRQIREEAAKVLYVLEEEREAANG